MKVVNVECARCGGLEHLVCYRHPPTAPKEDEWIICYRCASELIAHAMDEETARQLEEKA